MSRGIRRLEENRSHMVAASGGKAWDDIVIVLRILAMVMVNININIISKYTSVPKNCRENRLIVYISKH